MLYYLHAKFQPISISICVYFRNTAEFYENKEGSKNCPNDRVFYFTCHYINSYLNHMIESLFESQDDVIFYVLFSDLNLFYLIYGRSIFLKWSNIGTVFLATVSIALKYFQSLPMSS